jgi:Protein of unknown function (DUF3606)
MPDDPSKRGQPDRARINVDEKHELKHWSKKFSVSPDRLREAVGKVGSRVEDVERELAGGRAPGRDASMGT